MVMMDLIRSKKRNRYAKNAQKIKIKIKNLLNVSNARIYSINLVMGAIMLYAGSAIIRLKLKLRR